MTRGTNNLPYPVKAEILFTRRCNLRCSYCNLWSDDDAEISMTEWRVH